MSGGPKWRAFTLAWGKAKGNFLRDRRKEGKTERQANIEWQQFRLKLKEQHVHYPLGRAYSDLYRRTYPDQQGQPNIDTTLRRQRAKQQQEEFRRRLAERQGEPSTSTDEQPAASQDLFEQPYSPGTLQQIDQAVEASQLGEQVDMSQQGSQHSQNSQDPPNLGSPQLPTQNEAGGGISASQGSARGGAEGGGLAGAGNNAYFHGFANSTTPRDPDDYSYVDTYTRPWCIHTDFPGPKADLAGVDSPAYIQGITEQLDNRDYGWPADYHRASCDHNGILVPYWLMEASMRNCDWNKPDDHIAYTVEEIGFDIPNLRLNIMNNDRKEVTEVAPAPPADARMWMFIDVDNDYGIPQNYKIDDISHNYAFTAEDMTTTEIGKYSLPQLGRRQFLFEPDVAYALLCDRNWHQVQGETAFRSNDPNNIYDIKRHRAYHEFIMSEAKLGLSYKINAPTIRLPHEANTTLDYGTRQASSSTEGQGRGKYWNHTMQTSLEPHQWGMNTQPYMIDNPDSSLAQPGASAPNIGKLHYYGAGISAYTYQIRETNPITGGEQGCIDAFAGRHQVRPQGNKEIISGPEYGVVRNYSRWDTSDDGEVHADHISKRPPIFMFGIYKELEYRSSGPEFWRYFAYGQINYWVKIRWHVQPSRWKPYIHIGLGGVYQHDGTDLKASTRLMQFKAREKRRKTQKPMLRACAAERRDTTHRALL